MIDRKGRFLLMKIVSCALFGGNSVIISDELWNLCDFCLPSKDRGVVEICLFLLDAYDADYHQFEDPSRELMTLLKRCLIFLNSSSEYRILGDKIHIPICRYIWEFVKELLHGRIVFLSRKCIVGKSWPFSTRIAYLREKQKWDENHMMCER